MATRATPPSALERDGPISEPHISKHPRGAPGALTLPLLYRTLAESPNFIPRMTQTVVVPLWLLVILVGFSLWLVLDRFLLPSFRWILRRKVNQVIDQVNKSLDISLRPFQLTKRQVLLDRLRFDPEVMKALDEYAQQEGVPRAEVQSQVDRYVHEIVPSFNAYMYYRIGYWLAKKVARLLYRVRVNFLYEFTPGNFDQDATVVFIMNHRSNMDYILVSFLAARKTALSYAVGEWAKIWPLEGLIKSMGAFFVRRNSNNPLYRKVLQRYIAMAAREGVCQAAFPEGGLTTDGKLRNPRMGLINYMLKDFDPKHHHNILFVLVAINYDRTLEDRSLLRSKNKELPRRSKWFVTKTTMGFLFRNVRLMLRSHWKKFGYASVNFGHPISAKDFLLERHDQWPQLPDEEKFATLESLAEYFMTTIGEIIPVLPTSVVCQVLLTQPQPQDRLQIKSQALALVNQLEQQGAPVATEANKLEKVLESAIDMLTKRRLMLATDMGFVANPDELDLLKYYRNTLDGWLSDTEKGAQGAGAIQQSDEVKTESVLVDQELPH